MIEQLHIKNVALIENVEVSFDKGLNILSGETGAGKSMIIDAINFLLGERPSKDFIRHGTENASVEGIVSLTNQSAVNAITDMGIELDEENTLHLCRNMNTQGKTNCKINGKTKTIGMLKQISSFLADFHGQHEHQSLLNSNHHIILLDRFCGEEMDELKKLLAAEIKDYKDLVKKIHKLSGDTKSLEERIEQLQAQKDEIDEAQLKANEEAKLLERRQVLMSYEKLVSNVDGALEQLYDSESLGISAMDRVFKAANFIKELAKLDTDKEYMAEIIENIAAQLDDLIHDIRNYASHMESDPEELLRIENRLDLIHDLKHKYGGNIEQILTSSAKIGEQVELIRNSEAELKKLNTQKKEGNLKIMQICQTISEERKRAAINIKGEIVVILQELGMKNVRFDVAIERKKEFSLNGFDKVEFLISPNPGEDLKPLSQIASGGEMSRIMLALKTVLADADNIETFIFDEIDTGVSGRTAQQVAEKLALIAKNHQILCITHLPQIAAMADRHFLIEKNVDNNRTTTNIYNLELECSIAELARLIGGAKITGATLEAAGEMKAQAIQLKKWRNNL